MNMRTEQLEKKRQYQQNTSVLLETRAHTHFSLALGLISAK